jgi:hypothetical protein
MWEDLNWGRIVIGVIATIIVAVLIWLWASQTEGYDPEYVLGKWHVSRDIRTFAPTNAYSLDDTNSVLSQRDADILFDRRPYDYVPDPQLHKSREKGYLQRRVLNCSYPDYSWL